MSNETTATMNFKRQTSPEEEGFFFSSLILNWAWPIGFVVLGVIVFLGTLKALNGSCRFCCARRPRNRPAAPTTGSRSSGVSAGEFVETEAATERIPTSTAENDTLLNRINEAIAEHEALLNRINVSGLRTESDSSSESPATTDYQSLPTRHTDVRQLAPPAGPYAPPDLSAPPPSYDQLPEIIQHHRGLQYTEQWVRQLDQSASPHSFNQLPASNQYHRELQNSEQSLVRQLEDSGYFTYGHMLSDLFNRALPDSCNQNSERRTSNIAIDDLPSLQTPSTRTRTGTETNTRRDIITDPSQRSCRLYFNNTERLRELSNSRTCATINETGVSSTRHQPRPQTHPPAYHEVEQTSVWIARSDSLPTYDEFMATPSLVWYPSPSTNV